MLYMSTTNLNIKNKNMNTLIKIALVIGVVVAIYLTALVATSDYYWCFKDKDTCTLEEINYWRSVKEKTNNELTARYNEQMANANDYFDNKKINPLKLTLSASAVIKEAKEGDKRNVPSEFFTLENSLVPIAHADENRGDGWIKDVEIKDQDSISKEQSNQKTLRYQALLTSVGSPYADVDIESHCKQAGLTQYQCDILVGIGQSESRSGTDFTSTKVSKEEAIKLGKEVYHNPVGIKLCVEVPVVRSIPFADGDSTIVTSTDCPPTVRKPDENGMWIQKYDDWELFWITYTHQMKHSYFDRGAKNASDISRWYVGDNAELAKKIGSHYVKSNWVYRVESFINKL